MGIEDTLRRASKDDRVGGLFVRLPESGISPAAADELRLAFQGFRAAGKPIIAFSQGIYPEGVVTSTYELGAASGDFWMQPSASFQAVGFANEDIFFKDFFDKYGIVPNFQQRYQFKNAINGYLYNDYTADHRSAELSWMGSVYATGIAAAAQDRKLAPAALQGVIEAGPYSAEDAKAKGLIDNVGEKRKPRPRILKAAGDGAKMTEFSEYATRSKGGDIGGSGATIALIQAEGDIVTGTGGHNSPFSSSQNIYSDDLRQGLLRRGRGQGRQGDRLPPVLAGGSDTASEQILAAVKAAKAAGKAGGGQHGHLRRVRRLLDLVRGDRNRRRALDPDRLHRRLRRQVRHRPGAGQVRRRYPRAEGRRRLCRRLRLRRADDGGADGLVQRLDGPHLQWLRGAGGRGPPPAGRPGRVDRQGPHLDRRSGQVAGLVDEIGGFQQAVDRAKALAGISGTARLKSFSGTASPFERSCGCSGASADGCG